MGVPEDIARLELDLRELVIKYEQYFCGIEKREPLRLLESVDRQARRYQNVSITNTSQRFKYDSLIASLCVQKQKWNRINRLIEEGKYQRDRFKMALHQSEQESAGKGAEQQPAGATSPQAPADHVDSIYQQFLEARKACNLPTDNVTRDKIAEAIERQKPVLIQKYGCRDIEFVVVVEQGTPRLKARPKNA
jgi:anti-sigma28 factor (negative regulator of flagellin synthesis)